MRTINKLKSKEYQELLKSYLNWLSLLGFSKSSQLGHGNNQKELLVYLEQKEICFKQLNESHMSDYLHYSETRASHSKSGALSQSSVNAKLKSLKNFTQYLYQEHQHLISIKQRIKKAVLAERECLSTEEINVLYKACDESATGQLDKAILAIFYGCGLRASEGAALRLDDLQLDKKRLYVANGKGGKERLVPMSRQVARDLESYLYDGRKQLLQIPTERLFIGQRLGKPLKAASIAVRFRKLLRASDLDISARQVSLHSLRHSIASHLLKSGMRLEDVAHFLGHRRLTTTQIYTHLEKKNEL